MKHEIEIPDLPEGWEAVEILIDPDQYNKYVDDDGCLYWDAKIRMKKKQPRRIVIEEVEAGHKEVEFFHDKKCFRILEDNKCAE